jgi:hypothetical protein
VNAAEHFDWAVGRAIEYVNAGDGGNALASLVSDLNKHPDTRGILTADLQYLFLGEALIGGAQGARRFIEGLPRPAATPPADEPDEDHCGNNCGGVYEAGERVEEPDDCVCCECCCDCLACIYAPQDAMLLTAEQRAGIGAGLDDVPPNAGSAS